MINHQERDLWCDTETPAWRSWRKIVLQWEPEKDSATWTTVTMEFQPLDDGRTLVRITEFGWPSTPEGLSSSFVNCEGWTGMICAMKAWLEHDINLREGFYK